MPSSIAAFCRVQSGGLLLALLACLPAAFLIPPRWAWENGVLEILHVLVLVMGLGFAAAAYVRERQAPLGMLALCAMPLWAVLAAREMSWGAVLAAPLALTERGPLFSSSVLWYKPFIVPVTALLFGLMLHHIWRCRLDRLVRRLVAEGRIPWSVLGVALLAALGSSCAEGHLRCSFAPGIAQAMVFEELVELVACLCLVVAQAGVLGCGVASTSTGPVPTKGLP